MDKYDEFFDIKLNDRCVSDLVDARQRGLITHHQYIVSFSELIKRIEKKKERRKLNCFWRMIEYIF